MRLGISDWEIEDALVKEALKALPDAASGSADLKSLTARLNFLLEDHRVWTFAEVTALYRSLDKYAMSSPSKEGLLGVSPIAPDAITDQAYDLTAVSSLVLLSAALRALALCMGQHGAFEVLA
jgi:hypothetical protein